MSNERIKMTVTMQVTVPQALTLQAMFKHWNRLASMGCSRNVGFFVDGDGNFKPKCEVTFSEPVPELTPELERKALGSEISPAEDRGTPADNVVFDFDGVAWALNHPALTQRN